MRIAVLALFVANYVVGCKQDVTKNFEGLADRACACAVVKDKLCGKRALAEAIQLGDTKGITADEPKVAAAVKRMGECLLRTGLTSAEIAEAITPLRAHPR